jgi:hypothetical protein
MPKTKISEFSATPANNTDIDSINIAEGCAPSGINDAIRELMAQLKDFQTGAVGDSFNGPVGTSTAAAGAFTTLAASGNVTLSGGTANGVAYLNGSKVVTSGSALTYNGTGLGIGVSSASNPLHIDFDGTAARIVRGSAVGFLYNTGTASTDSFRIQSNAGPVDIYTASGQPITFSASASEQMRLTSTGLGIGTSSPAQKLHVENNANSSTWMKVANTNTGSGAAAGVLFTNNGGDLGALSLTSSANSPSNSLFLRSLSTNTLTLGTNNTVQATLDSSGNLGLGVTPSAWGGNYKAFQIQSTGRSLAATGAGAGDLTLAFNAIYDSTDSRWEYAGTGDAAVRYSQTGAGIHAWYNAAVGTAGNAITFTQAMTLDASGNLGIGATANLTAKLNFPSADSGEVINIYSNSVAAGRSGIGKYSGETRYYCGSGDIFTWVNGGPSGTERARIDSSGNLMVGQTSATGKMSVTGTGSGNTGIFAVNATDTSSTFVWAQQSFLAGQTSGQNFINFIGKEGSTRNAAYIGYKFSSAGSTSNLLTFGHFGADNLMNLDGSGNLLVGTTSPIVSSSGSIQAVNSTGGSGGLLLKNTSNNTNTKIARFYGWDNSETGSIQTYVNVTTYNTSSDQRLKTDKGVATDTSVIDNTIVHDFEWKADGRIDRGVFAQEAQQTKPSAVSIGDDTLTESGSLAVPWAVDYSKYIPDLIVHAQQLKKQVQEQQTIIESLKARLDAANL